MSDESMRPALAPAPALRFLQGVLVGVILSAMLFDWMAVRQRADTRRLLISNYTTAKELQTCSSKLYAATGVQKRKK